MAHQMNNKFDFCSQRTYNNNNDNNKMKLQLIQFTSTLIVLKAIVTNAVTLSAHIAMDADKAIAPPSTTATTATIALLSMDNEMRAKVSKWQKEQAQVKNVAANVAMLTAKSNFQLNNDDDIADDAHADNDEIKFDVKLNLNAKVHNASTSQTQLPSFTMDSLEQLRSIRAIAIARGAVAAVGAGTGAGDGTGTGTGVATATAAVTNKKPKSMTATKRGSSIGLVKYKGNNAANTNNKWHSNWHNHNNYNDNNYDSQPMYELQLVVWPADIIEDDIEDAWLRPTERPTQRPSTTKTTTTTTTKRPLIPLYDDLFDEESLDDVTVPTPIGATAAMHNPILSIVKPPPTRPSVGATTAAMSPTQTVYVVHDYHIVHPNGTAEYRLELSNGLINYKKIYNKFVDDYVVVVQEGYDSVPVPGREHEFQTQYYIADEHGYNVYKLEYSHIRPELPEFLSYYGSEM